MHTWLGRWRARLATRVMRRRSLADSFTLRYTVALVVMGVAVLVTTLTFARLSTTHEQASAVINTSGRQRMLSQRIALESLLLADTSPGPFRDALRNQLAGDVAAMETAHEALVEGSDDANLPGVTSDAARRLYFEPPMQLDATTRAFLADIQAFLDTDAVGPSDQATLNRVVDAARSQLLPGLEAAVTLFQQETTAETQSMQLTLRVLAGANLILLAGLAFGVFRPMAQRLRAENRSSERNQRLQSLAAELSEAMEMAEDEPSVLRVAERALTMATNHPAELLLADASAAHLHAAAVNDPENPPACPVPSPMDCPAVRRGRALTFSSGGALSACPRLAERTETKSALCIPVSFGGRSLGVLHVLGPDGCPPEEAEEERLALVANAVGARLGTVRAFDRARLQAGTDQLTGLANRRTLEERLSRLRAARTPYSLAFADIDHFKLLNDRHGHETGDRALRLFARTLRDNVREHDTVARWGGEEFILVFPTRSATDAIDTLERLRAALQVATATGEVPRFTASYGLTDTTQAENPEDLIRLADTALLAAKAAGRDRIVLSSTLTEQAAAEAARPAGVGTGGHPSAETVTLAGHDDGPDHPAAPTGEPADALAGVDPAAGGAPPGNGRPRNGEAAPAIPAHPAGAA